MKGKSTLSTETRALDSLTVCVIQTRRGFQVEVQAE